MRLGSLCLCTDAGACLRVRSHRLKAFARKRAFYADDTVKLSKMILATMLPDCLVERKIHCLVCKLL